MYIYIILYYIMLYYITLYYIINYIDTIQIKEQKRVFSRTLPLFSESGMAHKMLQWTQRTEFFATAPLVALC